MPGVSRDYIAPNNLVSLDHVVRYFMSDERYTYVPTEKNGRSRDVIYFMADPNELSILERCLRLNGIRTKFESRAGPIGQKYGSGLRVRTDSMDLFDTVVDSAFREPDRTPSAYKQTKQHLAKQNHVTSQASNMLKGNKRETLGILACFGIAATALCISSTSLLTGLAIAGLGITASSFINRFLLSTDAVSPCDAEKFRHLQLKAEEYAHRFGLKNTPEIRLSNFPPILSRFMPVRAVNFFNKDYVVFDKETLRNTKTEQLEGVLGHEISHIAKKHIWQFSGLIALAAAASLPPFITLPLLAFHSRLCEKQADRLGAIVSGRAPELASFLKDATGYTENKTAPSSLMAKAFKAASYFFFARYPSTGSRIAALRAKPFNMCPA